MLDQNKVELRKKSIKKLGELYDKRNILLAQVNNLDLEINGLVAIINYIDNKVDLDEFGDDKIVKK